MKRQRIVLGAVIGFVAVASGGWFLQRASSPEGSVYQQARMFDEVLAHVSDFYVDSIGERELFVYQSNECIQRLRADEDSSIDEKRGCAADAELRAFLGAGEHRAFMFRRGPACGECGEIHTRFARKTVERGSGGVWLASEDRIVKLPELLLIVRASGCL